MKKLMICLLGGLLAAFLTTGCSKEEQPKSAQAPAQPAPAAAAKSGTVIETMNAGGYTYVQVDTGSEKIWAAAPEFQIKVGDSVVVPEGMPMPNYHSNTLNRDFDMVYFVDAIMVGGAEQAAMPSQMPAGHPQVAANADAAGVELKGIKKAGQTVEEVLANTAKYADKEVSVRGKVVKYNAEIMGKNWLHVQDGTGGAGTNDLTVTTSVPAKVGDTVVVTGKLVLGKDFGFGYKYDAIIEDAKVVVE